MVDVDPREAAEPEPEPEPEPEREPVAGERRSKRRPVLVVAVVVAVLAAFLVVVFATSRTGGGDTADTPLLGEPAPAVGGGLLGGGSFDLGSRRGSWVVLNFFASWCDPCRQEAPELARFAAAQEAKGTDGAELVGVVYNDDDAAITDFLAQYGGGNFPVVVDNDSAIDFGVVKIPETWIIDPNGIVRARVISTVSADGLERLLQEAQGAQGAQP